MNRVIQFWQELKRRNIVRRNTVYVATAYVIFEFISIITEPFGLPGWTLKLVLVLLILGFIVSLILSWNYSVTSEGIQKTESASLDRMNLKAAAKPGKRKLSASDVVIAVLVVIVGFLAYPRLFKGGGNLNAMTRSVTVLNEYGEEEIHEVFMEDYLTKLAIFPFANESQDSSLQWLEYGIFDGIGEDLGQFSYLSVDWDSDVTQLNEQIKRARLNNYDRFLTGSFDKDGDVYEITCRLYQTENGTILEERVFTGSELFSLFDSISLQTRIDLGISVNILNSSVDLPFKVHYTDNLEAFEYATRGLYMGSRLENLYKAVELDSTFAMALATRAFLNYNYQINSETALKDIRQAMRHRHRLSEADEISVRMFYYAIHGESDKAIALAEMQYELNPSNFDILIVLIRMYWINLKIHKLEEALLKLNDLVPDEPSYQLMLADCYLLTGKLNKGIEVLEKLLADNPENTEALLKMGESYLHKNDLEEAKNYSRKAIMFNPEEEEHWSMIFEHFEYAGNKRKDPLELEAYSGYYRYDGSELVISNTVHNNHFLTKAVNQTTQFMYPISDSVLISYDGFFKKDFLRDEQNVVTKYIATQRNVPRPFTVWKKDSLILNAEELSSTGKEKEALSAYRRAYEQYPDHHYLARYIQHLEFIQSPEFKSLEPGFDAYAGEYGELEVYLEGKQIYYKNLRGLNYRLLPLSANHFMIPNNNNQIHFVKENGKVSGMTFVRPDEDEQFHLRSN